MKNKSKYYPLIMIVELIVILCLVVPKFIGSKQDKEVSRYMDVLENDIVYTISSSDRLTHIEEDDYQYMMFEKDNQLTYYYYQDQEVRYEFDNNCLYIDQGNKHLVINDFSDIKQFIEDKGLVQPLNWVTIINEGEKGYFVGDISGPSVVFKINNKPCYARFYCNYYNNHYFWNSGYVYFTEYETQELSGYVLTYDQYHPFNLYTESMTKNIIAERASEYKEVDSYN